MLSMPRIVRPDLFRIRRTEFGSPVGSTTRRSTKRNKELGQVSDPELIPSSQAEDYIADTTFYYREPTRYQSLSRATGA